MTTKQKIALVTGAFLFLLVIGASAGSNGLGEKVIGKRCTSPEEEAYVTTIGTLTDSMSDHAKRVSALMEAEEGISTATVSEIKAIQSYAGEILDVEVPEKFHEPGTFLKTGARGTVFALDYYLLFAEEGNPVVLDLGAEELRIANSHTLQAMLAITGYCEGILDNPTLS